MPPQVPPQRPYVRVTEEFTTDLVGVGSGRTMTGGGFFNARRFTTIRTDTHGIAKLTVQQIPGFNPASGSVTLPPGTYSCHIRVPGYKIDSHVARLIAPDLSAVVLTGS